MIRSFARMGMLYLSSPALSCPSGILITFTSRGAAMSLNPVNPRVVGVVAVPGVGPAAAGPPGSAVTSWPSTLMIRLLALPASAPTPVFAAGAATGPAAGAGGVGVAGVAGAGVVGAGLAASGAKSSAAAAPPAAGAWVATAS